jgi:hypothetical protein
MKHAVCLFLWYKHIITSSSISVSRRRLFRQDCKFRRDDLQKKYRWHAEGNITQCCKDKRSPLTTNNSFRFGVPTALRRFCSKLSMQGTSAPSPFKPWKISRVTPAGAHFSFQNEKWNICNRFINCITKFTCKKIVHQTLTNLQHVSACHKCHVHVFFNWILMHVQMCSCVFTHLL